MADLCTCGSGSPRNLDHTLSCPHSRPWSERAKAQQELDAADATHPRHVAYEFFNPATGHAIVDYSEFTHVGRLTAERGYLKLPLVYADAMQAGDAPSVPVETLRQHWLHTMECDHATGRDKPHCSCSRVDLGWHSSVGEAVEAWLAHVCSASPGRVQANPWKEAVLDQLAFACMDASIYESPESIIRRILDWHVGVATDPAVNGGFKLVPVAGDATNAADGVQEDRK